MKGALRDGFDKLQNKDLKETLLGLFIWSLVSKIKGEKMQ
jgi:hypothetical protein